MQTSKVSHISNNLAWGLVIAGGIVECFWASGLKYADNLLLHTLTGMGILFSFCCMVLAVKSKIEIGVVYSVFVGIGTVGVALSEIIVFGEPFSPFKIALILLLLIGVVGLKLCTSKEESANEQALAEELTEDLGLEEIAQSLLGEPHAQMQNKETQNAQPQDSIKDVSALPEHNKAQNTQNAQTTESKDSK